MARRNGLRTVRTIAYTLCQYITRYTPAISAAYPSNTALLAALAAANVACDALVASADESLEVGD